MHDVGPSPKKHRSTPRATLGSAPRAIPEHELAVPEGVGIPASQLKSPPQTAQPIWPHLARETVDSDADEAEGSNEQRETVAPGEPAVTDAAKAFRELRVRPAHSGNDRGGSGAPPSPKKRKATSNLKKEFILKDDKVKRATDAQGDISEARGPLGALLFEFTQIELNRDLLDAIKRTESKTGRLGRAASSTTLDRQSFERVVAETCELLQTQLSTVEAHTESRARRSAILRAYAVQAIAAFADEDDGSSDNDDEVEQEEEEDNHAQEDDEEYQLQRQQHQQEQVEQGAGGPSKPQAGDEKQLGQQQRAGCAQTAAHDLSRPRSAVANYSPPPQPRPTPPVPGSSGGEQVSSSVLPNAPRESALEDTAAMTSAAAQPAAAAVQQCPGRQQCSAGGLGGADGVCERGLGASEMRVGSEARACSSGIDAPMLAAPSDITLEDMVRSPGPVDSRPAAPKLDPLGGVQQQPRQQQLPAEVPALQQEQQQQPSKQQEDEADALLPPAIRPPHGQFKREASGVAGADSSGPVGSDTAAVEQPKRQRKGSATVGMGSALVQLLQRRQGVSGTVAPPRARPEEEENALGAEVLRDGATSGFRRSVLASQNEVDGEEAAEEEEVKEEVQQQRRRQRGGGLVDCDEPQQEQQEQREPNASEGARRAAGRTGGAGQQASGGSVWGSTLVCADLTVNDVASHYWPFLRSAMQGQCAPLHKDDEELIAVLVPALGEIIAQSYALYGGRDDRPSPASPSSAGGSSRGGHISPDLKSLVAATAFDDMFRECLAAESSGASGS